MSKKIISVVLAVMLMVSMISVAMISVSATDLNESPSSADEYVITGTITGSDWNPQGDNKLTAGSFDFDGKTWPYKYDAGEQEAMTHGFKITDGKSSNWDECKCWGKDGKVSGQGGDNYTFTLSEACNVTVYFNPTLEEGAIAVDAASLTDYKIESICTIGGGDDPFLHGVNWDQDGWDAVMQNKMSDADGDGIYEISYDGVFASTYQFKFAFNGSWQPKNLGTDAAGVKTGNEIKFDAVLDSNPGNIEFEVPNDNSKVTIKADLNNFDIDKSKTVPVTILIEEGSAPATEPTTAKTDSTTAPTTNQTQETQNTEGTQGTTGTPSSTAGFTVNAKSNISDTVSQKYTTADKKVTVTYYLKAPKPIGNTQFNISYDPQVLEIDKATHTSTNAFGDIKEVNFTPIFDKVGGTASNILEGAGYGTFNTSSGANPYDFLSGDLTDNVFLTITFNIVGNYNKDVDVLLDVRVLSTVVNGDSENTKDVVDYVYQGEVQPLFNQDCQTLTKLSTPSDAPVTPPSDKKSFKVNATSNYAASDTKVYSEDRKTVTVEYTLQASKLITSGQWELTYDPSILKLSAATFDANGNAVKDVLPNVAAGSVINLSDEAAQGKGYGNFSDISTLNDFTSEKTLIKLTFDIVGDYTKDTTINFDLVELVYGEKTGDTLTVSEYIANGVIQDSFKAEGSGKAILDGDPVDVEPVPTETTPATPEQPTTTPTPKPSTPATPEQPTTTPGGPGSSNNHVSSGNGTVQTSDSPMAFVLLSLLVAATGAIIVLRKRELEK